MARGSWWSADAATLDAIDQSLWTLQPTEFIPHCRINDEAHIVARSPVVLAESAEASLPDRPILVNLGAEVPARFERFERLIDIVGSDDADKLAGRTRWRHYKDRGYAIRTHPLRRERELMAQRTPPRFVPTLTTVLELPPEPAHARWKRLHRSSRPPPCWSLRRPSR